MKKTIKQCGCFVLICVLLLSSVLQYSVYATRIPEEIIENSEAFRYKYFFDEEVSYSEYGLGLGMRIQAQRYSVPMEARYLLYDWRFGSKNHEEEINKLLYSESVPAVIVLPVVIDRVGEGKDGWTTAHLQYVADEDAGAHCGMTFSTFKIIKVLRNPNDDPNLKEGNYIWLKQSYYYEIGEEIDTLYCEYGIFQKPLFGSHLIFLDDMYSYNLDRPLPRVWQKGEDGKMETVDLPVYAFDERYVWNANDPEPDTEFYPYAKEDGYDLVQRGLYADYFEIQYKYYEKVMSYFGLMEKEIDTNTIDPATKSQKKIPDGPNLAAILISVAVLAALGALTYTVNQTVKKSKTPAD